MLFTPLIHALFVLPISRSLRQHVNHLAQLFNGLAPLLLPVSQLTVIPAFAHVGLAGRGVVREYLAELQSFLGCS